MPVTYDATIEQIDEIAPQTRSFHLRLPNGAPPLRFKPGQFLSCLLPIAGETLIRPYSLASSPEDERLEICLNLVDNGPGSTYLFSLAVGAALRFTGPWGTFTLEQRPAAECIFIAEGTGIAPIRPMLRRALAAPNGRQVCLHYAAASAAHLLYARELESMTQADFSYEPLIGGGLADLIVRRYVDADADRSRHFYICAVGPIVPQLRDLLRQAGYERRAVQYEKW
jgi:ferredoxin-NADP reductase